VFLSYVNSAIAYANTSNLLVRKLNTTNVIAKNFHPQGDATSYKNDILSQLNTSLALVPSTDSSVLAGYQAVYEATANQLITSKSGQVELLLALTGTQLGTNTISVQAALQRPFR